MAKLKKYEDVQKKKGAVPPKLDVGSGVACTEPKCKGEMMILQPEVIHPQYNEKKKELKRAICGNCGWKGWV